MTAYTNFLFFFFGGLSVLAFFLLFPCCSVEGGIWKNMKDAYREGREEAKVKQIKKTIEERTDELWRGAMRRKMEEARYLEELMRTFRKGNIKIYLLLGAGMLIYLCERNGAGCDSNWYEEHLKRRYKKEDEERKRKTLDEKNREVVED